MTEKQKSPPVVVAGGSGFLGQNVVLYLLGKGRRCVIVDQQEPSMPSLRQAWDDNQVSFLSADLTEGESVRAITSQLPEHFQLVNMATVIEVTKRVIPETEATLACHTGIAMHLVDSWRDRLKSVCFISSFEVYGDPQKLPFVELHPKIPNNVYSVGKLMSEQYLRIFCTDAQLPLNILRLSHLYGPGEWHNKAIPNFIKNCLTQQPHRLYGGGKDVREPVHVRDVAYAILLALDREEDGIFNIAGGHSLNIREMLDAIQRLCGTELPVEELPADRPPLNVSFDLSHAAQELGFVPQISLEEGLREEIEWFRSTALASEVQE